MQQSLHLVWGFDAAVFWLWPEVKPVLWWHGKELSRTEGKLTVGLQADFPPRRIPRHHSYHPGVQGGLG